MIGLVLNYVEKKVSVKRNHNLRGVIPCYTLYSGEETGVADLLRNGPLWEAHGSALYSAS